MTVYINKKETLYIYKKRCSVIYNIH